MQAGQNRQETPGSGTPADSHPVSGAPPPGSGTGGLTPAMFFSLSFRFTTHHANSRIGASLEESRYCCCSELPAAFRLMARVKPAGLQKEHQSQGIRLPRRPRRRCSAHLRHGGEPMLRAGFFRISLLIVLVLGVISVSLAEMTPSRQSIFPPHQPIPALQRGPVVLRFAGDTVWVQPHIDESFHAVTIAKSPASS